MPHNKAEDPEEDKENGQTEEHDTHSQQGDADSIGVLTLQLGIFRLVSLDEVLNTWRHVLRRLHTPFSAVTGIALVSSKGWDRDGVDQLDGFELQ